MDARQGAPDALSRWPGTDTILKPPENDQQTRRSKRPPFLTPEHAGKLLGLSRTTIERMIRDGRLRGIDFKPAGSKKKTYRVLTDDIFAMMRSA